MLILQEDLQTHMKPGCKCRISSIAHRPKSADLAAMEITTLITWNGLIYLLYYGLNMAFDYLRSKNSKGTETVNYTYQDLLKEMPSKVDAPAKPKPTTAIAQELKKQAEIAEEHASIIMTGPVEDQSIPMDEIIKNTKSYSGGIDF